MDSCQSQKHDKAEEEVGPIPVFIGSLVSRLLIAVTYTVGVWVTVWVLGWPK